MNKAYALFLYLSLTLVFFISGCNKEDKKLIETEWVVNSYSAQNTTNIVNAPASYTMTFKNKNFHLALDVNTCGGDYSLGSGNKIKFSALYCTEACCDSDFAMKITQLIPLMKEYTINGDQLLLSGQGKIRLIAK